MDIVLGTAGHIDHGKTSLIRALTGINCDRLNEEQRRGITIELGFAWLDLDDGRRLGIVDVPGHERFVKAMVAGAAGIDCVLLVVAADEGVMPQTREHLDICSFLGVSSGLVAMTKTDMVDGELLQMAKEDVRQAVAGTFLQDAPILEVSALSGQGLDDLKRAINKLASEIPARKGTDIFRLPVDRVFTLKGHGTIVTGTLVSGFCSQGEEVRIMPEDIQARARSLQVHGSQVKLAHQGMRCAINLQGVDVKQIRRGDVVAKPDTLFPSRRWIVKVECPASSPHSIRQRMEVHFHHGSSECLARLVFRDRNELAKGEAAVAEVHFSRPLPGVAGDHCVLRAHSPLHTIGGCLLLDPLPEPLRKRDPLFTQKLASYEELGEIDRNGKPEAVERFMEIALSLKPAPGADEKHIAVLTGFSSDILAKILPKLEVEGKIICWDRTAKFYIDTHVFDICLDKCVEKVKELHEREPLKTFFASNALFAGWGEDLPAKFAQKLIEEAVKRKLLEESGNGVKLAAHKVKHDADQETILKKLQAMFQKDAYSPPFLKEINEEIGEKAKKAQQLINFMCETGQLVKIQEGIYYNKEALEQILEKIREWFKAHDSLDVADMKSILGISRKYAIPLLEYMDGNRITRRVGNTRQLIKNAAD